MRRKTLQSRSRHGLSRTQAYKAWIAMIHRCTNPEYPSYPNYGGRGITVCQEWIEDVRRFVADLGHPPGPEYSLERLDNNGPYAPHNCVWATATEQTRNRRTTRLLTHEGVTKTVQEWAKCSGLKYTTLLRRIDDWGWTVDRALQTTVSKSRSSRSRDTKGRYV